jgi:amino acid adenylation domain-containing protein
MNSENTTDTELFPVSPAQRSLIVSSLLSPTKPICITGGTAEIEGAIDEERFAESIKKAINHFDALRISFFQIGEEILQSISSNTQRVELEFIDLSSESNPIQAAERLIEKKFATPFNLFDGTPPFRNLLIKVRKDLFRYHPFGHHALIDGWGFSLLTTYVLKHYNGADIAIESPSYLRVITAKNTLDDKGRKSKQNALEYWGHKYKTTPERLFTPKFSETTQAHLTSIDIEPTRYSKWLALASQHEVTISSLIISALLEEIGKISGVLEPVIGTPMLNRSTREQKDTLGLFTHIIPLSTQLKANESLFSLAERLGKVQRQDYRHSMVSIDDISRAWGTSLTGADPLQVTVSFEKHSYDINIENFSYSITAFSPLQQKRPLQIYVREYQVGSPIRIDVYANDSFFSKQTSRSLLEGWVKRLNECDSQKTEVPSLKSGMSSLSMLPFDSLWSLFENNVGLYSNQIAIEDEDGERLSYQELYKRAKYVGDLLYKNGMHPQDRVGLSCKRNIHLIVGMLGILSAGGTYVPLDPDYPAERLRYLTNDSKLSFILADLAGQARCKESELNAPIIDLISIREGEFNNSKLSPRKSSPSEHAYIIYTSGSTGLPKGCAVTHHNVLSLLASVKKLHGYNSSDVWTMFHSYAFDFSVWEIWGALGFGGRLLIVSQNTSRDAEYFYELLINKSVTVLSQTPTAFRNLLQAESFLNDHAGEMAGNLALRRIIFGGEALDLKMLQPWFERHGEIANLINMYGITETTVHVTSKEILPSQLSSSSLIGNPIPGWTFYILGPELQPLPKGVIGEIYVGGNGVSDGYWGRPSLTAERFLPDPFANNGQRMYRSGDLARLVENNEIEYLGRADHQVKIRGFRIELGEIQNELLLMSSIKDAIVLADKDISTGEHKLIAWIVPATIEQAPNELAIREQLLAVLPSHMIPSHFVFIESIPLTINGKLDRELLKKISSNSVLTKKQEIPTGANEILISGIWQNMFGITEVFKEDNFFNLGGDSIYALRFISQLRKSGLSLQLAQLYENPKLTDLADKCIPIKHQEISKAVFNFEHTADIQRILPLSSLQAGMMFHNQLDPDSSVFLDVFDFDISGDISPVNLQYAIDKLSTEIPALRTSFDWINHPEPVQVIWNNSKIKLKVEDLSNKDKRTQEKILDAFTYQEKKSHFDLEKSPLFRITYHKLSNSNCRITIAFHHSILDGWSFSLLMSRMLFYALNPDSQSLTLLPEDIQEEFIAEEKKAIKDTTLNQFWGKYLEDMPHNTLRTLKDQAPKNSIRNIFKISAEQTDALQKMANVHGIPLKLALLASHLLAQSKLNNRSRITTGYVVNCRPEIENADLAIGIFLNTIPLKTDIPQQTDLSIWLRNLKEEESLLFSKRKLPLIEIQKLSTITPLFDNAFNYVHFHSYNELLQNHSISIDNFTVYEQTDFPFLAQFSIDPRNNGLELTLVTQEELYPQENLQYYVSKYVEAITLISEIPFTHHHISDEGSFHTTQANDIDSNIANKSELIPQYINNELSEIENQVFEIWRTLLQRDEFDLNQSFFSIGGDSILATRMVMLIRKQFSINLPLRDFMSNPSLIGLAGLISESQKTNSNINKSPIPHAVRRKKASSEKV